MLNKLSMRLIHVNVIWFHLFYIRTNIYIYTYVLGIPLPGDCSNNFACLCMWHSRISCAVNSWSGQIATCNMGPEVITLLMGDYVWAHCSRISFSQQLCSTSGFSRLLRYTQILFMNSIYESKSYLLIWAQKLQCVSIW